MIGPDGTPSGLIAHLHVLREQARVVQVAAAGALSVHTAAEFAQACDQAARGTLHLAEADSIVEPVDEQLAAAAQSEIDDAPDARRYAGGTP